MKTEEPNQEQLTAMYARLRQVFTRQGLTALAPQQKTLLNNALERVIQQDGIEALTLPRLEGIKELITQHLWSDALTAA